MLKKRDRLTAKDIEGLSEGKSVFGTLVSFRFMPAKTTKFAVSVTKKASPLSVGRSRIRRRVYGALEKHIAKVTKPVHGFFIPKKEVLGAPFEAIREDVEKVLAKAGLFR